jgi:hypothetical protein
MTSLHELCQPRSTHKMPALIPDGAVIANAGSISAQTSSNGKNACHQQQSLLIAHMRHGSNDDESAAGEERRGSSRRGSKTHQTLCQSPQRLPGGEIGVLTSVRSSSNCSDGNEVRGRLVYLVQRCDKGDRQPERVGPLLQFRYKDRWAGWSVKEFAATENIPSKTCSLVSASQVPSGPLLTQYGRDEDSSVILVDRSIGQTLLAMLPRVFSVMVTQRRSGFESRNIRFEGPSSNM